MTLHIGYDHKCPKCEINYIPYDKDVPCPGCGEVEEERFEDFISRAVVSMKCNLNAGSYMPAAWYIGGLGDNVLMWLFRTFEALRLRKIDNPELDTNSFLEGMIEKKPCDDESEKRLRSYSKNMILRIKEEIEE